MSGQKHIEITKDVEAEFSKKFEYTNDSRREIIDGLIRDGLKQMKANTKGKKKTIERIHMTCSDDVKADIDQFCKSYGGKKYEVASEALRIGMKLNKSK